MTVRDRLAGGLGAALVGAALGLALATAASVLLGHFPPAWQTVLIPTLLFGGRGLVRGPRASDVAGPVVRMVYRLLAAGDSPALSAPVASFQIGDFVVVLIALVFLALWFASDA
jgi:hypothetical protein